MLKVVTDIPLLPLLWKWYFFSVFSSTRCILLALVRSKKNATDLLWVYITMMIQLPEFNQVLVE